MEPLLQSESIEMESVRRSPDETTDDIDSKTKIIAAAVAGTVGGLALLALLVFVVYKIKSKPAPQPSEVSPPMGVVLNPEDVQGSFPVGKPVAMEVWQKQLEDRPSNPFEDTHENVPIVQEKE